MTAGQLPDHPVYIGGLERSGKTYVRLMLAAHPTLAVTKRTNLWTQVYDGFGNLADSANLDRCLSGIMNNKHIRALEPDGEYLRREFRRGPRTYAHLFALLHRRHAERLGKIRWGDQTESLERFADPIVEAFPRARIIHMLRDPRDQYEAIVARGAGRPGRLGRATARWRRSAHLALRNQRRYPDHYKVVRYESLILKPEEILQEICSFLGIASTPDMLALGHAARFEKEHEDVAGEASPLSAAYIGRFHEHLAPYELAYIQQRTGMLMAAFGYSPVSVRLSPMGKLRCDMVTPIAASFSRLVESIGRARHATSGR